MAATNGQRPRHLMLALCLAGLVGLLMTAVSLSAFRGALSAFATSTAQQAQRQALVERLAALSERIGRVGRALADRPGSALREDLEEARTEFRLLRKHVAAFPIRDTKVLESVRDHHRRYLEVMDRLLDNVRRDSSPGNDVVTELQARRATLDASLEDLRATTMRELRVTEDDARDTLVRTFHLLLASAAIAFAAVGGLGLLLARALVRLEVQRKALTSANEELRAVNADLDAFAGRLAHDLRNLLTPLDLSLTTLENKTTEAVSLRHIHRARRASDRALALIRDLLDFSRAGRNVQPGATSVRQAVADALSELEAQRAEADVTVTIDVEDFQVTCAPALFHAILANLIGNAFKFVSGQSRRHVSIGGAPSEGVGVLKVADTGPGIPPESRDKIFRAFFRSVEVRQPGTGLGLAIVQRIVEAHGGTVTLLPTDAGACFAVRLPLAAPAAATALGPLVRTAPILQGEAPRS